MSAWRRTVALNCLNSQALPLKDVDARDKHGMSPMQTSRNEMVQ